MVRAFLSIEISEAVRLELSLVRNKLKKIKGIRWVAPDNIHLTLKFLGDIEQNQVDDIKRIISSVCLNVRPMTLEIGRLGAFPDMDRPRIVWAGVGGEIKRLLNLQNTIDKTLQEVNFPMDKKNFFPHLTIGRIKKPEKCDILKKEITGINLLKTVKWRVDNIVLFKSQLMPEGAVYTHLWDFPLNE